MKTSIEVATGASLVLREPDPALQQVIAHKALSGFRQFDGPSADTAQPDVWPGGNARFDWGSEANARARQVRDQELWGLAGHVVLDLGHGGRPSGFRTFIKQFKPAGYVGVGPRLPASMRGRKIPEFGAVASLAAGNSGLPGVLIGGDPLEMLGRLPDDSVDVAVRHADAFLKPTSLDYRCAVAEQIARVVRPAGLVFGVTDTSGLFNLLRQTQRFDRSFMPFNYTGKTGFHVLAKIPTD